MPVQHVTPKEALDLVSHHKAVFIDVREENEIQAAPYPLKNILYSPFNAGTGHLLDLMPQDKKTKIIVACHTGGRSLKIAQFLDAQGYQDISNLEGGIVSWKSAFPQA